MKRRSRRKEQLNYIVETNKKHCDVKPVYGQDLCDAVNIFIDPYGSKHFVKRDRTLWHGPGQIHCHCAKFCQNPDHPKYLWNQTKVLSDVIHTPEQYLAELQETLDRYIELQIRLGIEGNSKIFFSYFSMKTFVVNPY